MILEFIIHHLQENNKKERGNPFDNISLDFQSTKIKKQWNTYIAKERIFMGETVFAAEELWEKVNGKQLITKRVIIGKNDKWNMIFENEHTVVATEEINAWTKLILRKYPERNKPLLFSVSNPFVYVLVQFFAVIVLMTVWFLFFQRIFNTYWRQTF